LKLDGYLLHIAKDSWVLQQRKFIFAEINPFKFWVKINLNDYNISNGLIPECNDPVPVSQDHLKNRFLWLRWKALFYAIFKEDYFSTYLIPYVLAYAALVFAIIKLNNA
jgi:hypothetical protein